MDERQLESARTLLASFMQKMHEWEVKTFDLYRPENGGPEKNGSLAKAELKAIYDEYLTERDRKTGRLAGPSAELPPEYDLSAEEFISSEPVGESKVVISTKWTHPEIGDFSEDRRYTMVWKENGWRLDKKEIFSVHKDKWINQTL
ncbi:NTF2 fold immunity protein [Trinickia sp.]|uniref:NTF2 fold immunity protein n=1 Tax=Trinickia sp. TaxID=2571163 RepID=UPI003F7F7918